MTSRVRFADMSPRRTASLTVVVALLLTGCSAGSESDVGAGGPATSAAGATSPATEQAESPATTEPTTSETPEATETPKPKPHPVSLPAYFLREPDGGDLRLGTVRERTTAYTSYDASYRSGHLRVTGVLNVPTGRGPFPAIV